MGFTKPTWTPGHERNTVSAAHVRALAEIRKRRERHTRDRLAARHLEGSLISLAALLGADLKDPNGDTVGELRDVVVAWTAGAPDPRMTGIVARVGRRDVLIGARWIEVSPPKSVCLRSTKAYVRAVAWRSSDVALARDVLEHQVVDADGTQIVRPADVHLAEIDGRVEAVGIEVGDVKRLRLSEVRAALKSYKTRGGGDGP
jgi:hypothetical protein